MSIPTFTSDAEREFWQAAYLIAMGDALSSGASEEADEAIHRLRRRMPPEEEAPRRHRWKFPTDGPSSLTCTACGVTHVDHDENVGCPGPPDENEPCPSTGDSPSEA